MGRVIGFERTSAKKLAIVSITLIILFLPVVKVSANIPSVLSITRRTEGSNTLVDVKVSHQDPSTTHYIAKINLDLDGTIKTYQNLTKATVVEATYTLNIGAANPKTIKAQAVCIVHGPGIYFTEVTTSTPGPVSSGGGIPAFPFESLAVGLIIALIIASSFYKKKDPSIAPMN